MPANFKVHAAVFSLAVMALFPIASLGQTAPAAGGSAPANAPTKIGLVDILEAMQATNEGQKELEDLGKRFVPRDAELKGLSEEIDRLKKQLEAQSAKLTEEQRASQIRTIEAKQKAGQRNYDDFQNEIQQAKQDILNRLYQKMAPVLEKYASSNGYTVVLDVSALQQGAVLWWNTGTVITKQLVDAYNAQSPVPPPPAAPKSGAQAQPQGATGAPSTRTPVANTTPKKP